ncbi:hypothetical protein D3C81_1614440 [compost metagenome]
MGGNRIAAPGGVDKHGKLVGTPGGSGLEAVTRLVRQARGVDVVALGATYPALFRKYYGDRLGRHQLVFRQGLGLCAFDDRRATGVAIGFGVLDQFGTYQLAQFGFAAQQGNQFCLLLGQFVLFVTDFHLFETRQLPQACV